MLELRRRSVKSKWQRLRKLAALKAQDLLRVTSMYYVSGGMLMVDLHSNMRMYRR